MDKHEKAKSDIHQIVFNLLQDKRELLVELHDVRKSYSEQNETIRKLNDELNQFKAGESCCSRQGNATPLLSSQNSKEHKREDTLQRITTENSNLKEKISTLEKNLCECRTKLVSVENQNLVLQNEVMRLARALSTVNPTTELELSREQMKIYEQDYKREKTEKDVAERKLHDCEELLSTFTTQIELYKRAFKREKEEKEELLKEKLSNCASSSCSHFPEKLTSEPFDSSSTKPLMSPGAQFQLVHTLSESKTQGKDLKRKQELQRKGILIRDSKPTEVLYGGDVKIDQYPRF